MSWFFLWHLLWLSIMQLRHYFFIGTLNPTLNRLARNDPHLGKAQHSQPKQKKRKKRNAGFYLSMSHPFSCMVTTVESVVPPPSVSQYTNAFAITQLCGVLCAPWNGMIMDRHKGKKLDPGEPTLLLQVAPVFPASAPHPVSLLQERRSRRPTCAPPASPSSSPPCRACCSRSVPRSLSSSCSTSHLFCRSSTAPSSTEGMQRSSALCEQPPHACTHTHSQYTFICQVRRIPVFYVCVLVFQPVILGSCTVWPCPCLPLSRCCSTPVSPWSEELCVETPST